MSKPQVGGYEWRGELVRIRNATNTILESLQQMLEGNLGPQAIVAHGAKMIRQVGIILNALGNIEQIGAQAKADRTK
jgi:hypothetical protein